MANTADDEKRINTIRFLAVDAVQKANSGHPGMPLGAAAAAYTLWSRHMQMDPADLAAHHNGKISASCPRCATAASELGQPVGKKH